MPRVQQAHRINHLALVGLLGLAISACLGDHIDVFIENTYHVEGLTLSIDPADEAEDRIDVPVPKVSPRDFDDYIALPAYDGAAFAFWATGEAFEGPVTTCTANQHTLNHSAIVSIQGRHVKCLVGWGRNADEAGE